MLRNPCWPCPRSDAATHRWTCGSSARPSLEKMALMRFSTADSESTKARAMAALVLLSARCARPPACAGSADQPASPPGGPPRKQQLDNTRIDDRASRRCLFEAAQQLVEIAD